jgi:transcriptional regulator with AAA-type ATPase domain
VVAASKADLLKLSAEGQFREDLYYRIGVVSIDLPALNQRSSDIPLLLAHFCQAAAMRYRREPPPWTAAQMQQWQQRDWPGNVRELRNFADRWVLGVEQITAAGAPVSLSQSLPEQVEQFEAGLIAAALKDSEGSVAQAADGWGFRRRRSTTRSANISWRRLRAAACACAVLRRACAQMKKNAAAVMIRSGVERSAALARAALRAGPAQSFWYCGERGPYSKPLLPPARSRRLLATLAIL